MLGCRNGSLSAGFAQADNFAPEGHDITLSHWPILTERFRQVLGAS